MPSSIIHQCRNCGLAALLSAASVVAAGPAREPVDYVNPNIGGIGHLLQPTVPSVQLPHGMARLAPVTTPGVTDRYLADKIYGFPAAGAALLPVTGTLEAVPDRYASEYDHDLETVTPYWSSELLENTMSASTTRLRAARPTIASRFRRTAPRV